METVAVPKAVDIQPDDSPFTPDTDEKSELPSQPPSNATVELNSMPDCDPNATPPQTDMQRANSPSANNPPLALSHHQSSVEPIHGKDRKSTVPRRREDLPNNIKQTIAKRKANELKRSSSSDKSSILPSDDYIIFCAKLFACASMAGIGALIRVWLATTLPVILIMSFITNIIGCFILGICKGYSIENPFISIALGTGLCGSITTFSSYNYEATTLVVKPRHERSFTPQFGKFFASVIAMFASCAVTYYIGECLGILLRNAQNTYLVNRSSKRKQRNSSVAMSPSPRAPNDKSVTYISPQKSAQKRSYTSLTRWAEASLIFTGIAVGISFLIENDLWLAIILAPFGACLRWYLGSIFNTKQALIPFGTLMANILGSFILTLLLVLTHSEVEPKWETLVVEGFTKGFCGCLTTVSTFVSEIFTLSRRCIEYRLNTDATIVASSASTTEIQKSNHTNESKNAQKSNAQKSNAQKSNAQKSNAQSQSQSRSQSSTIAIDDKSFINANDITIETDIAPTTTSNNNNSNPHKNWQLHCDKFGILCLYFFGTVILGFIVASVPIVIHRYA